MDPFERLRNVETTTGLTVGVVVEQQLSRSLAQFQLSIWTEALATLIIIATCIFLVKVVLEASFGGSRTVRRLLLGKYHVEGHWFDVMRQGGKVVHIGVSHIEYSRSQLQYSGFDFSVKTRSTQPYSCEQAWLNWPDMRYKYRKTDADRDSSELEGFGTLKFQTRESGAPTSYAGEYYSFDGGPKISFEGIRLTRSHDDHKALLDGLDQSPEKRKEALEVFFHKKFPDEAPKLEEVY